MSENLHDMRNTEDYSEDPSILKQQRLPYQSVPEKPLLPGATQQAQGVRETEPAASGEVGAGEAPGMAERAMGAATGMLHRP